MTRISSHEAANYFFAEIERNTLDKGFLRGNKTKVEYC
ncbi:hypothetical protein B4102_0319 [Heyndrickxia sporothermodurans]|uniref:Uncharacterized protein n=1 Tax=Heyndrickxia sporothermodurans TaxID=46224 RepID=A0A150KSE4_9BACI|nr:hypothetical protein B4102_0319 [Heyndrickxia sporothermodurans]